MYKCECGKEYEKSQSLNAHYGHCLIHRNGKKVKDRFGKKRAWSKGLTYETDERIKNQVETLKEKYRSGELIPSFKNKHHTDEAKNKISIAREKLLEHDETHCKWYNVFNGEKEIKVQGTWEKIVAETLTANNIIWERKKLIYNKIKRYTPDFYLPKFDMYIEVKGWWKNRDIIKINLVLKEHNIDLRIIDSLNDIKKFKDNKLKIHELKKLFDLILNGKETKNKYSTKKRLLRVFRKKIKI